MAVIPVLGWLGEKIGPWLGGQQQGIGSDLETAPLHSEGVAAIVVGAGRVGRLVSQMLKEHGVSHVITDNYASAVVNARNDGMPAYFGMPAICVWGDYSHLSATRIFALRLRLFALTSSSVGLSGFFVRTFQRLSSRNAFFTMRSSSE